MITVSESTLSQQSTTNSVLDTNIIEVLLVESTDKEQHISAHSLQPSIAEQFT